MEMWIARDKNGELYLYNEKPFRREKDFFLDIAGFDFCEVPKEYLPSVTWENSPQRVILELAPEEPVTKKVGENIRPILDQKIADCGFSVRVNFCLKAADINTIGELVKWRKCELLKFRNFGIRSLKEIEDYLAKNGLNLT